MFDSERPFDPAELPLERLEHEITELAAHINAGSCRWLELIAEFDRREGWGSGAAVPARSGWPGSAR